MEVIVTLLLCTTAFLLYLLNKNRNEISELKAEIHRLKQSDNAAPVSPPANKKRFVRVIFTPDSTKCYDYLLGNNPDVKIGDFVEVYVSDKKKRETFMVNRKSCIYKQSG